MWPPKPEFQFHFNFPATGNILTFDFKFPIQQPPPVWVPGSGSVETWDLVIDENYCYGHLSFSGLRAAQPR